MLKKKSPHNLKKTVKGHEKENDNMKNNKSSHQNHNGLNKTKNSTSQKNLDLKKLQTSVTKVNPLDGIKEKVNKILTDSQNIISSLSNSCSQIDKDMENEYNKAQNTLINQLNELFNKKEKQIKQINEKYNYDLYKSKEYYPVKKEDPVYSNILKSKTNELKQNEEDFINSKNAMIIDYETKIKKISELFKEKRSNIFKPDLINELKQKITNVLDSKNSDN